MSLQNITADIQLSEKPFITTGDRIEFQLLVVNLLQNAVDAYDGYEATRRKIDISSKSMGNGKLEICVRDYGKGVDEDVAEFIFDSFRTTKDGGTGLGLSISRSVVENMGGQISLTPKSGESGGSAFLVQLPGTPACQ